MLAVTLACSKPHPAADASGDDGGSDGASANHPNIIFILTDDLNNEVYSHMPKLKTLLDDQGTRFEQHMLNISLCCPSRTAILRGQYAHNTKIFGNNPPDGGFERFYADGSEAQTLPVWMAAAGYRTALYGKYLNGYPNTAPADYVPPGWAEWASPAAGNPYSEYNYTLNENKTLVPYGATPADYLVDVISNKANAFIKQASSDHVPFYLHLTPYVPHSPATPPDRYLNDFPGAKAPRTPSFNEADVSDKPTWLATKPLLTQAQINGIDQLYGKRLRSMEAIEDLVQSLVDTLQQTGQLDNTYIVFTSDNGFHQGQHRLVSGKNTEFDEDLLVPLIVRGPGVAKGATVAFDTINVDFAPTFLDLAGVTIPDAVDGRSLKPLLAGTPPAAGSWRDAVFLEHAADIPNQGFTRERQSVWTTLEPDDVLFVAAPAGQSPPPFEGVRTDQYTYVEYMGGERALYDHTADPAQMNNIAGSASAMLLGKLSMTVHAMHACSGAACRTAEQTPQ